MRFQFLLASSLAFAGLTSAQTNTEFHIYPSANTPTSNPSTSASWYNSTTVRSESLQEVPGTLYAGIADNNTACQLPASVPAFQTVMQDQDASTQETYSLLFRRPLTAGTGPDVTTAGEILRGGPFQTPTGVGVQAWRFTYNFTGPLVLPCEGSYFYGVEFGPATLSPANGLGIHGASYRQTTPPSNGDNPRFGAPNHGWVFLVGGTAATSVPIIFNYSLFFPGASLQMGGIDPNNTRQPAGASNYGAGGMYPDVSGNPRADGLDARVRDTAKTGGPAFLFMSRGRGVTGPITIPGITGRFRMDVTSLFGPFVGVLTTPGEAVISLAPPGTISPALLGATIFFQGITIDPTFTTINLTNVAGVTF
jgi:hypothetical protein